MVQMGQQDWEKEREAMKEEKKRLEYMLFDLIKARDGDKVVKEKNMSKVMRIKAICEE